MKKLFATIALIALAGCAPQMKYKAEYDLVIGKAQVNGQSAEASIKPDAPLVFEDGLVRFRLKPFSSHVYALVENISPGTVSVVWDRSSIINSDGQAYRVYNSEMKSRDITKPVPPSLLPAGTVLKVGFAPITRIRYTTKDGTPILEDANLMPVLYEHADDAHKQSLQTLVEGTRNKDLYSAMITLEANGEQREYRFWFRINDARFSEL
jgi:hypothetical protein